MKPILFKSTEKTFNNNGIGILSDAAFCEVTEERNGIFELVLDYPISGIHFNEIQHRSIILAKPNATADPQPFRVYKITKPMNGMITVYAEHISYDLSGIAVLPFEAGSAAAALQALKNNSVVENPFEFWTDKSTVATMDVKTPASVRAMLGGVSGSVLDTYGGEYEWDGYIVKLYNKRGQNRGVSIRYGKNLIDLTQEENCQNVYTAVLPFWSDGEGNSVLLDEKTVSVEGTFDFVRVFVLDLSSEFENQPTKEELKTYAEKYIKNNKIGVPHVSINLSFVQLEQTEEYKNKALLERVNLCDEVNVVFEKLGISATAEVVKTVYNVLLDRYESVELGDAKSNIADTIVKQEQAIKDAPKQAISMAAKAAENATQLITGNRGGYVVIHSSTGQSQPDEILIMDKPTIEEAVKVWRWNNSGLGYSENGYPGPYVSAWTIDGAFNADFITAGTISANLIKSGLLQSLNEISSFDMDSGTFTINQEDGNKIVLDKTGMRFITAEGKTNGRLYFTEHQSYVDTEIGSFSSLGSNHYFCPTAGKENSNYEFFNGNSFIILNKDAYTLARLWGNENGDGELYLAASDGAIVAQLKNKPGAGGQLELRNENGNATFSFSNSSGGGAECWIGQGNGVYKVFDYNNGINVHADHFHFWGKSSGLVTNRLSASECSAYIIMAKPNPEGGYVSIIVPSQLANGSTMFQITDDDYFWNFYVNSNGTLTHANGTNLMSSAVVYSIR